MDSINLLPCKEYLHCLSSSDTLLWWPPRRWFLSLCPLHTKSMFPTPGVLSDDGIHINKQIKKCFENPIIYKVQNLLIWSHPSIILTPHNEAVSDPNSTTACLQRQLKLFEAGNPMESVVDRKAGYPTHPYPVFARNEVTVLPLSLGYIITAILVHMIDTNMLC